MAKNNKKDRVARLKLPSSNDVISRQNYIEKEGLVQPKRQKLIGCPPKSDVMRTIIKSYARDSKSSFSNKTIYKIN